jgi:hypothetical protein
VHVIANEVVRPSLTVAEQEIDGVMRPVPGKAVWSSMEAVADLDPFDSCGHHPQVMVVYGDESWTLDHVHVALAPDSKKAPYRFVLVFGTARYTHEPLAAQSLGPTASA